MNVCDGDTIRVRFINTGFASNQVGWYLLNSTGDTVTSHIPGGNLTTGYKFEGSIVCTNTCPPPLASFTLVQNGLAIDLDGSASTGTSLNHIWTFGDGNSGSGPITNHNYVNDGIYTVELLVMDQCGQMDSANQVVTVCDTMISPFTYTLNQFQADFNSGLDSTVYSSIIWDFGDGQTSNLANPINNYAVGGSYYVSLSALNICGDTLAVGDTLEICTKPIAEFTWFIVSSNASGMLVQFDATSSVNANTFTWYWGDGTSSTGANFIQHLYSVPSLNYTITLVISNQCALGDTSVHTLNETNIDESEIVSKAKIYPNPKGVSQILNVSGWSSNSSAEYEVVDGFGRVLYQGEINTNSTGGASLPNFDLPAGMYRIRLIGEDYRQNFNVAIIQ
jgi:PKD repeat protein